MKTLMMIPKLLFLCSLLSLTACVEDEEALKDALGLNDDKLELTVSPKKSDISVATNLNAIFLSFNDSVEIENITSKQIILSNPPVKFHLDQSQLEDSNILYLILDEKLQPTTKYTFFINNIRNLSTDELKSFAWEFTTLDSIDVTAPLLVSTLPLDSAIDVSSALTSIELTFNENIKLASFNDVIITPDVTGVTSIEGNKLIFKPDTSFKPNENYRLVVNYVSDLSGNILASEISVNFLTIGDSVLPTIPTLTLSSGDNSTSPSFSWNAATDASGIAYYKLKRGQHDVNNIVDYKTLSNTTLSFTDAGLETDHPYFYQLEIGDNAGNIVKSNIVTLTTPPAIVTETPVEPTPNPIVVTDPAPAPVAKSLTLTWSSPTRNSDDSCLTDLQGYSINFKDANSGYALLKTVALDSLSLNCTIDTTNSDTTCGGAKICSYQTQEFAAGTWFFKVQAVNTKGTASLDSNEASSIIN